MTKSIPWRVHALIPGRKDIAPVKFKSKTKAYAHVQKLIEGIRLDSDVQTIKVMQWDTDIDRWCTYELIPREDVQ